MPLLGEICALATAFLWSGSSLVFAAATTRVGSVRVNVARLILAAIYLGVLVVLSGIDLRLTGSQIMLLSLSGISGLTLGDTFLFQAYRQIGARLTMLIMSVSPAITAGLAFVTIGEGLTFLSVAGILVTLIGIALVVFERNAKFSTGYTVTSSGLLFGVLAALGQAVGLIFAKLAFVQGEVNGFVATLVRILAAVCVLVPASMVAGRLREPIASFVRDRKALLYTAAGSVLGPFLGISLSLIAIAHTSLGVAATIMATVPIVMLPLVHFIHKEALSPRAIVGAFIAVSGVAILFLR